MTTIINSQFPEFKVQAYHNGNFSYFSAKSNNSVGQTKVKSAG